MPKIFTIGFSGKSPDTFMDVLNAVRVRAVWDIRQWRASTYVPFYSGDNLTATLGPRYEYHPEFAHIIIKAVSEKRKKRQIKIKNKNFL